MKHLITATLLCLSSLAPAELPKYYGYDWIDPWPTSATVAYDVVKDHTNLNVVHSIKALNSRACAENNCVLNISAGQADVYTDICPNKTTDEACSNVGYVNIWNIVASIKQALNKPVAIYFIDEPFFEPALKSNNVYVPYRYSSYICTLNEAMAAYSLTLPVFTILSDSQYKNTAYKDELTNGIPSTGCPATIKSTLSWIGIDNYNWTTAQEVINAYKSFDPTNKFKWVLVPASSYDVATESYINNFYKEAAEIQQNFVYILNFRYDARMFGTGKQSEVKTKSFGTFIKNLRK